MEDLLLGVARAVITPKIGANLAGYKPDNISTAINDDLTATVFYFKQENKEALLITTTLCSIKKEICDELFEELNKRYNIPVDNCMLAATHTHSGPIMFATYGWGDIDVEYKDTVFMPSVIDAVGEAISNAESVTMAVGVGESYVGVNRRELTLENKIILGQNPWGPFDPRMTILAFKNQDGEPIANLIHYGAHGTAAGMNTEISRDWHGVMIDTLERESGAITAFIQGAEGDTGPRLSNGRTVGGGDISYAMRLGSVAAQDAVRIYKTVGSYHKPKLLIRKCPVKIPFGKRIPLEIAEREYELYKDFDFNIRGRKAKYYKEVIESYKNGYTEPESYEFNQSILTLGDVTVIGFPYEIFSEIALRIAKASQSTYTLSLTNVNGTFGYFATEPELCRGGYEIEMFRTSHLQPFVDNADWHLVCQTLANVNKEN